MPSNRPSNRPGPPRGSSSESDSDAPESFSLAESKKSAKRKNEEIEKAHTAIKRQGKRKNQERDRTLKEQAKRRKESVNKESEDAAVDTPETRMERAMKEAQEEGSEGGDSEGEKDGFSGLGVEGEDMESGESSSDGMDDESEEILAKRPPKHLPDHLFEVAFASQNAQLAEASTSPVRTSRKSKEVALASKKKKRKAQSKDMVIGSRTIRTLSSTLQTLREGSYAPMLKAQKYIDRSLALKGGSSRARGWQRKPANIGVMRHDGPAANFVRS